MIVAHRIHLPMRVHVRRQIDGTRHLAFYVNGSPAFLLSYNPATDDLLELPLAEVHPEPLPAWETKGEPRAGAHA